MLHTQGIILSRENWREVDQRLVFYTTDLGKLILLATGLRKGNSKLAGQLQPFTILDIFWIVGKKNNRLIGAQFKEQIVFLTDLNKIVIAQYVLDIINQLIKPEKKDKRVYQLLIVTLREIAMAKNNRLLITDAFILKLLALLGYQPRLFSCRLCKQQIKTEKIYFDFSLGGTICSDCYENRNKDQNQQLITPAILHIIQSMLTKKLSIWHDNQVSEKNIKQVNRLVQKMLLWHLNKPLPIMKFVS